MMFFTGMHHPHNAGKVPAAFVSVHALERRRSGFPVRRWVLDSGAFTTLAKHGGYPSPPSDYAFHIRRFRNNGKLLAAVTQDYMCEPMMLEKTGLTIRQHQTLTVSRYDELISCDVGGVPIMPVLQGYSPEEYLDHLADYGERLKLRHWVGVGSVCKRNSNPDSILQVLLGIKSARPDLRLHGFGVKRTALEHPIVRRLFFSTDSMAWSYAARREGRDANDPQEAISYGNKIRRMCASWKPL